MKNGRAPLLQAKPVPAPPDASGQVEPLPDARLQEAVALHRQGLLDQAELLYKDILLAQPRHFDALQLLATIAVQRNHSAEALVLFELALKIHPDSASALSNRGPALLNLNRPQEALESCDRALQIRPDYAEALSNRGNALWALRRPQEALASFDHALRLKPDYPEALSNRGAALRALNRHAEALDSYDRALRLNPAFAQALNNRGAALQDLNRHAEALESFISAQQVQPDYAEAWANESLCRLMLGEFEIGWQKYEWRWKKEPAQSAARNFPQPLWLGQEPLQGKTILLHAEQGLGDTIQFCRYATQVAALGARVILEVQPALKALLQDLSGTSIVLSRGETLPDFDYHCPLLSLPLAFKADLSNISGQSYLQSEPQKRAQWQERLGPRSQPRVGLVWSGSTGHQNDHNRSLTLADIEGLLNGQASFYCLQKELRPADQARLANTASLHQLQFLGERFQDFSDTAAAVSLMDVVITVDTSVAHLAGAMGKEVWILLPFSADWRWLMGRSDSPWYASARLFRQSAPGDWAGVLGQVQAALKQRLGALGRESSPESEPASEPEPEPEPPARPAPAAAQEPAGTAGMAGRELAIQLTRAVELHQRGQLDQAEVLYRQILQAQPGHFDALQLLATIEAQKNKAASADVLFERALAINPLHAGALNNHGNVLRALKRPEAALASYDQALQSQPDYAEALGNRGNVLHDLKRLDEALAGYDQALRIRPDFAEALRNRGNVLRELKRPDEALKSYDAALQIEPANAESLANRGSALRDMGRFPEALASYDRALAINPEQAATLSNRGVVLGNLKRPLEALANCDQALRLQPDFAEALNNRGTALAALNRHAEALDCYDRALQIRPDYADALSNQGPALRSMGRISEALQSYRRALQIQPDHVEAHWNEALCRLMLGEFEIGWQKYEWRWKRDINKDRLRAFSQPLWLGQEPLQGKTVLLHAEQGLGDTLQFCRYATQVAALGARVVLEVQPPLKTLLQGLEGVSQVIGRGERLPDFDYHCPLLSLPLAFKADLSNISGQSYLQSEPQKRAQWQERLGPRSQPRVGLVWSGSTGHQNDHNRSLTLADIEGLLNGPAQYYCLQKELRPADQARKTQTPGIEFLGERFEDFSDTAAAVSLMDVIITVDTSVAHLAGAMGKEVWILLPFSADWRWLIGRSDSPWYASARLFRQSAPGDWAGVLGQVQAALKQRLSGWEGQPGPVPAAMPPETTAPPVATLLAKAVSLHQQGQLDRAGELYQQILQVRPQHFDALQGHALIQAQRGDFEAALLLFEQSLILKPGDPATLSNCGNVLRHLNRPDEALRKFDLALQSAPGHIEALINRGNVLSDKGQHAQALESYDRALKIRPDLAQALSNRGNVLQELQRPQESLESYDRALALQPALTEAWANRGRLLFALKRPAEALESYDRALRLQPDANVFSSRAVILQEFRRYADALQSCDLALRLSPHHAGAHSNRGNALRYLNRPHEAIESYERALAAEPAFAEALVNQAAVLLDLNRPRETFERSARALQLKPDYAEAHWSESLGRLMLGEFEIGWQKYEWRWKRDINKDRLRAFNQPLWLGQEPLQGKTVLLHAEQGLGDTLQFCRYATQVAALGARVVLEVQPPLKTLLQGLEGVSQVIGRGERLPEFDYHCPLLSLPLAFKADLSNISGQSYLQSDPHKRTQWEQRLGPRSQPRVGLVWSGSTGHQNDHNRSLTLADIEGLLNGPASFYCLQKELRPADQARKTQTPGIEFLGERFEDFSDTAAAVSLMDVVITVDTSVAHLAGAMGKEVWILLPFSADWRWLIGRSDSPWYASARLFRQSAPGDWVGVLAQVQAALKQRLGAGNDRKKNQSQDKQTSQPDPDPQGVAGKLTSAFALHRKGDLDGAEVLYREILAAQPRHFEALQMLATIAAHRKDHAAALVLFERALEIRPDHVGVLNDLGNTLQAQGKTEQALQSYGRALEIQPDFVDALVNRGNVWRKLDRVAEALASYDRALQVSPDHAEVLNNRGVALLGLRRPQEALASYQKAWHARPDYAEAHWNEALCQLLLGNFAQGWQNYEWRWKRKLNQDNLRHFPQPLWLGQEPLQGKTILLHAEQGLGDTLQFCRYATQVAALGARVILEVQPALKALLQDLPGTSIVLSRGETLPDFDYHCPLLSLPLAFKADLSNISGQSYLQSEPQKRAQWQQRLGPRTQPRVSLVWSGSTGHQNDHNRSLTLADIEGLLHGPASFYCLQKELRPADQATLANTPGLTCLGDSFQDFSDTAAAVSLMDVVITVDTSVAHLAGAMGKEVWILLPFSADWRWLIGRSDSPWYASARLFRQSAPGDWAGVLGQVQAALKQRLAATEGESPESEPESGPASHAAPAPAAAQEPAGTAGMAGRELAIQLTQAVELHQRGQLDQAEVLYRQILQAQPGHFDALQLLGTMAQQRRDPVAAMALFDQALKINPRHPSTLNNRGNALRDLNRPEEALASYDQALRLQPDYAEVLTNRGAALRDLQRYAEALESYDRALALQPDYALALSNRGNVLRALNRPSEALASYDRALAVRPEDARVLSNRGNALQDLKRPQEALQSFDRALQIQPVLAEALSNRGKALWDLQRPAEALESYERALQIKPDFAGAWSNRGGVLRDLGRHAEALACFGRALQLEPGSAEAHWNESLCRLMLGEFDVGWQKYEWRWKKEPGQSAARNFAQALWLGQESVQGKTVLLHAEQGLGDTIQFCRYATQVAALGARVILEVQPPLKTLLQGLEGVSQVIGRGERLPEFDYHCPLLSLPLAFKADLGNISGQSYLQSEPQKRAQWQQRLGPRTQPRVGLVWSGSTGHQNDHNRSLTLADIEGLLNGQASFYCLQKELRPADQARLAETPGIEFLGERFEDFSDTAAAVSLMDVVITVDTSVAHLAGAMGKEVWILLPFSADWRWLIGRSDSPWYASARPFRQSAPGDWAGVLGHVQAALSSRLQ